MSQVWKIGKIKSELHRGTQRYKCKSCGCNYTERRRCYPDHIKLKAIKYYLEGNGFRRIERLMHISHVSVINWVKKLAYKLKNIPRKNKKVNILELDEMYINLKKNMTSDVSMNENQESYFDV